MPEENNNEKSFAELLESSGTITGQELKVGEKVKGKIINISQDKVYVDTGSKVDGIAEKESLIDDQGNFPYQEGEQIELFVVSCQQNEIRLAPSLSGEGSLELIQEAMESRIPVEGKVKETCKGGYRIRIMGRMAFCPFSQIDVRPVEDPNSMVGLTKSFLIIRVEEKGRNIVVSRRALLEKEQAESFQSFIEKTKPGDIIQGTVTRVQPYGAFVRVAPELEGLVHVSELNWSKTLSPEEVVSPGDTVKVKVLNIKDQEHGGQRIELSMKQTQADPWEEAANRFKPETLVTGTVTRIADFGVFVEIAPGIEGLVHISEMSYIKRVHKPEDEVSPGDRVTVVIKDVDSGSRRISLSMRDAEGDPWLGLDERYHKGMKIKGLIEKREDFGLLVKLEPGVIGLVPKSKLERSPDMATDKLKAGDNISVTVAEIDQENRRITLAPADSAATEDWTSYAYTGQGLGTLGDKLKQAMEKKQGPDS